MPLSRFFSVANCLLTLFANIRFECTVCVYHIALVKFTARANTYRTCLCTCSSDQSLLAYAISRSKYTRVYFLSRRCVPGWNSISLKSGNFGQQVNSDIHLQTVDIQMRQLLMSRLIRIYTVCLVILFFIPIIEIWNKQGRCPNLADRPNLPDFTLINVYIYKLLLYFTIFIWKFGVELVK